MCGGDDILKNLLTEKVTSVLAQTLRGRVIQCKYLIRPLSPTPLSTSKSPVCTRDHYEPYTYMFEGLRVMRAGDEGCHGLERLTQNTIIRVFIGGVLTEILEGKVIAHTLSNIQNCPVRIITITSSKCVTLYIISIA